jgi:hypothetical protein
MILAEAIKLLNLPMKPHLQPYTIDWLCQGRDLYVRKQWHISYGIKPFKYEILCGIYPLEVCDVLLGKPYF